MSKDNISQWDTTAANNTDIGGISLAENVMKPPAVNNAFREMMAQIKKWSPLKGHIFGLTLSNNSTDATNDIDIAAGEAASTETDPVLMVLASALTKRLDAAWAVGTGNGGLDTGSIANTTYHVWLIRRSDTGVVDALFSASATAPTMPTNYDQKSRIGSIVRVSGAIKGFSQQGDEFLWTTPVLDVDANNPGTSAVLRTLTVPAGIKVGALLVANLAVGGPTAMKLYVSSPDVSDQSPASGATPLFTVSAPATATDYGGPIPPVRTDTSGRIRTRVNVSDSNTNVRIATLGYIDRRGKDA